MHDNDAHRRRIAIVLEHSDKRRETEVGAGRACKGSGGASSGGLGTPSDAELERQSSQPPTSTAPCQMAMCCMLAVGKWLTKPAGHSMQPLAPSGSAEGQRLASDR